MTAFTFERHRRLLGLLAYCDAHPELKARDVARDLGITVDRLASLLRQADRIRRQIFTSPKGTP